MTISTYDVTEQVRCAFPFFFSPKGRQTYEAIWHMKRDGETSAGAAFSASDESGPLYKLVERKILQGLAAQEWKPGEKLPPENELARRFGVAVFTVRAGVRNLVASNILMRRQGKGTFVTIHGRHPRFRFFNIYRNDGVEEYPSRRVFAFTRKTAQPEVARRLRMRDGASSEIFHFTMILETGDGPVGFYDIFVPTARFSKLKESDVHATTGNMYGLYQERFGITVVRTEERISAIKADARIEKLLSVPVGEPVMLVDRIAYTFNDEPIELRRIIHESQQHHYLHKEGLG